MERTQKSVTGRTELTMARSMCWHCQSEVHGEYLCERCVKVQPLSKELDYFTCLGLPRRLMIDPAALEARFYQLSRTFHPDFFHGKSETEQAIALGNSALLNTAYRTLKDPIKRAEYLLSLEAGACKDIRTAPPADLFEQILALQEDLEEFRSASAGEACEGVTELHARLQKDREDLERRQQEMERRLFELFAAWDALQDRPTASEAEKTAVLREMRELLSNRTYLRNIVDDLVSTLG